MLAVVFLTFALPARADPLVDPARLAAIAPPAFARAPMDLAFRDQRGRAVTLGRIAGGRPMLLVPVQHGCRNLCGVTLAALGRTLAALPARERTAAAVVAFGIDPRETPADAARSAARLGGDAEALVGDARADAAVSDALGYRYTWVAATGQYAHMAGVAVLAGDGRLVRWLPGLGVAPAQLEAALDQARRGRAPGIAEQIRLLCFHFDPARGRYTLAVWRLIQWAGGGAAALLAAGVGLALWRERRRAA